MKMIGDTRIAERFRSLGGRGRSGAPDRYNEPVYKLQPLVVVVTVMGGALAACRIPAPVPAPVPVPAPASAARPARPAPVEFWVDAYAVEGGDGTEARPYRSLDRALARGGAAGGARFHVRTGLYRGPFTLPPGAAIDGPEAAVLFAEGGEGAVVTAADASLTGVSLQGGATGLAVLGPVRAVGVHFSGQRTSAVQVRGGRLELVRADVQATISEVVGVRVERGRALVADCAFSGPFRRAILGEGAEVEVAVERTRFVEAVTAVQLMGARGRLKDVAARGGRGPAVFVGLGGDVEIDGLEVDGHEHALLSRDARLRARGVTSRKAEQAGIGLVKSRATLEDVAVSDSGPYGGVDVVGGEVELRRFRIERAASFGVHARSARVAISDGRVDGVASERDSSLGDGVHLREAKGTVERVTVRGAAGSGLLVSEASEIRGADLVMERCRWGGVVVETLSTFTGRSIGVSDGGGAALVVSTEATAEIAGLTSARNQDGTVWAECNENARVTLRGLSEDAPRTRLPPCVRVER